MNSRMDSTLARQANIPYPYRASRARSRSARRSALSLYWTSTPGLTAAIAADDRAITLVLKGEKRYDSGLTFLSSYVFSKTFTLRSDRANAGDGRAMNHFNRDAEKALSAFDQTHVIKLNYSYELPFGPGKPFVTTGALSKIAGGGVFPACIPTRRGIRSRWARATVFP